MKVTPGRLMLLLAIMAGIIWAVSCVDPWVGRSITTTSPDAWTIVQSPSSQCYEALRSKDVLSLGNEVQCP